ncbi:hypothetical protein HD806DRAFT_147026 [Xylariaceae sp. AK1471]|nr:hypothetical protein HD806DRAFT_147026 [Xylariaceae sp. AK1471]
MKLFVILLLSYISLIRYGSALQTTPGSACAAFCLDNPESDPLNPASSNTTPSDITCTDDSYENSTTGIKFKNCLDCLQKSNATSGTENDVSWFLYNIRYSVDVCLFGFPEASKGVSSPCNINWACQPLKTALEAGNLDATRDQFEYCSASGNFTSSRHIDDCIKCFASSPNQGYMSNFVTALRAGCEQKPAPGELIGLSGSLFTDSLVNITTPPVTVSSDNKDTGFGITSTGAIVGISLGGALLFLGGLALFWVYHRRQKRIFQGVLTPNDPGSRSKSITPPPHPPYVGGYSTAEKRAPFQMSDYELRAQKNYTNNAAYYDMLEKEMQANRPNYITDTNNPRPGYQSVLPTHPAYLPRTHSRQSSRGPSPQPPRPIKTNKPDSYALQTYLNAADDANALGLLPPPPPGPPPAAVIGDQSQLRGPSPSLYPSHSRNSSVDSRGPSPDRRPLLNMNLQSTSGTSNLPPPPPPPPSTGASKVPSLSFPSVSRIRIPKKYTPPSITVQGATPIDGPSEPGSYSKSQQQADISIGLDISRPMISQEQPRFEESHWERRRQPPPLPLVIEQSAVDRRQQPWITSEFELKTGKSSMYG